MMALPDRRGGRSKARDTRVELNDLVNKVFKEHVSPNMMPIFKKASNPHHDEVRTRSPRFIKNVREAVNIVYMEHEGIMEAYEADINQHMGMKGMSEDDSNVIKFYIFLTHKVVISNSFCKALISAIALYLMDIIICKKPLAERFNFFGDCFDRMQNMVVDTCEPNLLHQWRREASYFEVMGSRVNKGDLDYILQYLAQYSEGMLETLEKETILPSIKDQLLVAGNFKDIDRVSDSVPSGTNSDMEIDDTESDERQPRGIFDVLESKESKALPNPDEILKIFEGTVCKLSDAEVFKARGMQAVDIVDGMIRALVRNENAAHPDLRIIHENDSGLSNHTRQQGDLGTLVLNCLRPSDRHATTRDDITDVILERLQQTQLRYFSRIIIPVFQSPENDPNGHFYMLYAERHSDKKYVFCVVDSMLDAEREKVIVGIAMKQTRFDQGVVNGIQFKCDSSHRTMDWLRKKGRAATIAQQNGVECSYFTTLNAIAFCHGTPVSVTRKHMQSLCAVMHDYCQLFVRKQNVENIESACRENQATPVCELFMQPDERKKLAGLSMFLQHHCVFNKEADLRDTHGHDRSAERQLRNTFAEGGSWTMRDRELGFVTDRYLYRKLARFNAGYRQGMKATDVTVLFNKTMFPLSITPKQADGLLKAFLPVKTAFLDRLRPEAEVMDRAVMHLCEFKQLQEAQAAVDRAMQMVAKRQKK
jgi:hypothetical protein